MVDEIDDGLTDEEREALESKDDIVSEEETEAEAARKALAEEEAKEKADAEAKAKAEADAEAKAKADAEAAAAGDDTEAKAADEEAAKKAAEEAAAAEAKKPAAESSSPLLVVQAPENADAKLKEISDKKAELLTKFDDGDITAKEYQTELDSLAKQERQVEWAVEKAKLAQEMETQRQANDWKATVDRFIMDNDRYSPDKSPRMYQMLDLEVRAVAVSDEFKGRNDAAAGREILQRAHENIMRDLGIATEAKPNADDKGGDKGDKKIKHPAPEPSLHKLPAADLNDVKDGKYAALDRLANSDPMAYEDALMKLPEAERNAYLASA